MKNYGWKGSFEAFIERDKDELVNDLCMQIYDQTLTEALAHPSEESTTPQIKAWYDCIQYLMKEIVNFQDQEGFLIFEYEIPRTGRRRPDVLFFLPGELLVLEFKQYTDIQEAEYVQLSHYVRDLESYQSSVQEFSLKVRGALISTGMKDTYEKNFDHQIYIIGGKGLRDFIWKIKEQLSASELIQPSSFLSGVFQPIPSIIEAAKSIMRDEPLPQVKNTKSSNFDHVIHEVTSISEYAKQNKTHHLVLVSGVPGAGKTFVGLTLAHDLENTVYLSGNVPLVEVLQDSLHQKTFVQHLYIYKNDYLRNGIVPNENVIIFDEAQRAWDAKRMRRNQSEPDVIIEMAMHKEWSVVIGLVGEGQEIHIGEEAGISLWNEAIKNKPVHVHARHHKEVFNHALQYYENSNLYLRTSLRTHNALMYFEWVEAIIAGEKKQAAIIKKELKAHRYIVKVVDSLDEARSFVRNIYQDPNKTYGIVASSSMKNTNDLKVVPFGEKYTLPKPRVAYFNYPDSPYYCKNLNYAATEFQIQGLELDMAILYWGKDLQWKDGKWKASHLKKEVSNSYQMKLNAYRVLLTRGRDGVVICKEV